MTRQQISAQGGRHLPSATCWLSLLSIIIRGAVVAQTGGDLLSQHRGVSSSSGIKPVRTRSPQQLSKSRMLFPGRTPSRAPLFPRTGGWRQTSRLRWT
ncbi:hypothetical protein QBC39DRAFT_360474 [Podospora conica]|nr:hypothetical protein QBC39DRAFT_360474 [Schizothecium conicum]